MKILIADDHSIVRKGLKQIVGEMSIVSAIDEADCGEKVLDIIKDNYYDIIILDISMPGKNGMQILTEIKKDYQFSNILMLSTYSEDLYAIRALKAGAAGYLNKATAPDELQKAIQKISEGGRYVSASLAEKLAERLDLDFDILPHEKLSEREFDVMLYIASGNSIGQIAEKLFLSPKTISTYRSRILEKMNLPNNAQITNYVYKNGLLE